MMPDCIHRKTIEQLHLDQIKCADCGDVWSEEQYRKAIHRVSVNYGWDFNRYSEDIVYELIAKELAKPKPIPVPVVDAAGLESALLGAVDGSMLGGLIGKRRERSDSDLEDAMFLGSLQECLDAGDWPEVPGADKPFREEPPPPMKEIKLTVRKGMPDYSESPRSSLRTAEIADTINTGDLKTIEGVR